MTLPWIISPTYRFESAFCSGSYFQVYVHLLLRQSTVSKDNYSFVLTEQEVGESKAETVYTDYFVDFLIIPFFKLIKYSLLLVSCF